jgi:hypothetical protein
MSFLCSKCYIGCSFMTEKRGTNLILSKWFPVSIPVLKREKKKETERAFGELFK